MKVKGIEFYGGDIRDLPICRYNQFNAHLLNDIGVGNDMPAIQGHLSKLVHFAGVRDMEAIAGEANNLLLGYYSMLQGLSFKSRAFATLVKSIDGVDYGLTLSEEDIEDISGLIERRLTVREAEDLTGEVKKKFLTNWV
jgi:hypothetical protein